MWFRSTPKTVVPALLVWGMVIGLPLIGTPKTSAEDAFSSGLFVVETSRANEQFGVLSPDAAFRNMDLDTCAVPPSLPLLNVPTVPQSHSPMIQASYEQSVGMDESAGRVARLQNVGMETAAAERVPWAEQSVDRDSTNNMKQDGPLAGLRKLGESQPLALDNLPRLVITTMIVLAACVGTLLLARRWLMRSGMVVESPRNRRLQIVASLSIAPRSQLHVVKFDDREVLVGVDSRGLQQLQMVAPSFDAVFQTSQDQDLRTTEVGESPESRRTQSAQRLFTAV